MKSLADEPQPESAGAPIYLNRELSWLDFNARVLAQAEDESLPVLERAKFLAIFSSNLDEFFQVRVSGLKDQVAAGVTNVSLDGLSPAEQLAAVRNRVDSLVVRSSRAFIDGVVPALAEKGIVFSDWKSLDDEDRDHMVRYFEEHLFPVLTPLAVDPGHPFPYISNLSLNLAVTVCEPGTDEERFARVKVPALLPRFVVMPDGERFVPLEQVIAAHLHELFPGMEIRAHFAFRVTRNADLTLEEDEAEDLLVAVEDELRRRRFGRAVRLEIDPAMDEEMRQLLLREIDLEPTDIFPIVGPLDLAGLWSVHGLDRPDLKAESWLPTTQPALSRVEDEPVDIFAVLRKGDVLVHHPYDSFATSVEAFIRQAASDPHVLAIKQTLYRTSGDSPIVKALIRAAERGKQVAALVEVKARFDEQANIAWARQLEQAGVHVVYGLVGLKTHSKTALVVRQEGDRLRRYCHVGTGNYNPHTARIYEDIGLLTADPKVGADLTDLFNFLTGYSRRVAYERLVVAPQALRERVLEWIGAESSAGSAGRIIIKANSIADRQVIDALYAASEAGVQIDLLIRGICCLRPGVSGLSENIRVQSIVGRYLEHSRIFAFGGTSGRPVRFHIGSADLMTRNLDGRVEALVPVDDPALAGRIQDVLDIELSDETSAWDLLSDGTWLRREGSVETNAQLRLQQRAERAATGGADLRLAGS